MAKKKQSKKLQPGTCHCLACRLQTAIMSELIVDVDAGNDDADDPISVDACHALAGLGPTLGMFLAGLDIQDAERYWIEVLNERARLITPEGVEYGPPFQGRA
jgi:hypothetical protein